MKESYTETCQFITITYNKFLKDFNLLHTPLFRKPEAVVRRCSVKNVFFYRKPPVAASEKPKQNEKNSNFETSYSLL